MKMIGIIPKRRVLLGLALSVVSFLAFTFGNWSEASAKHVANTNQAAKTKQVSKTKRVAKTNQATHVAPIPIRRKLAGSKKFNGTKHEVTTDVARILVDPLTHDTAVVCAIMKNDERYLQEWLDYYLLVLGFDHIYLYDNSDSFNIATWMEETEFVQQYRNRVTLLWLPGYKQQIPAFRDCGARAKARNHTWAFFPDSDEYLILPNHTKLLDFCDQYVHRGYLGIKRRYFGTSGQSTYLPLPMTLRFQCRERIWHNMIKPFVRVVDHDHENIMSPHRQPMLDGSEMMRINPHVAIIHHYFSKSSQEFAEKIARGGAASGRKYSAGLELAKAGLGPTGKPISVGKVRDNVAWERLKHSVPRYAEYENHELLMNLTWPC